MQSINVDTIIEDIEFELMQGILPRDDIGQGILALKRYQNKLRTEILGDVTSGDRNVFTRLFRFNDMLITILQEMAEEVYALRRDSRRFVFARRRYVDTQGSQELGNDTSTISSTLIQREVSEIRNAMRDDALWIDLQARLVRLPILGRLLGPLQIFLHRPGLFYARLLANRQVPINRIFGNWILDLDEIQKRHDIQIARLNSRIADLESRLKT